MSTKKKLCEMLNDLSAEELEAFKSLIELEKGFPLFSRKQLKVTKTQDVVELMVETYSQECLELTKHVLKNMNRTDLVQRCIDNEGKAKKAEICEKHNTVTHPHAAHLFYISSCKIGKYISWNTFYHIFYGCTFCNRYCVSKSV